MRAGHQLQAAIFRHRVDRYPGADAAAVHVVVGLILMPWGALPGPALLHEHVIVVEADLGGAHQRGGDSGHPRMPCQLLDPRHLLPPAEIFCERARVIGAAGHLGQRPRTGEHRVDRGRGDRHLGRVKHRAGTHHAVTGQRRGHVLVSNRRLHGHHPLAYANRRPALAGAKVTAG
ncbi:MAG TPA: hypothetical protein VGF32_13105 [Streptosporangiaceae bacterium]